MTNTLTGDFDAALEFSVPAANRILAAQHQLSGEDQMYFHSLRMRLPGASEHGVRGIAEIQVAAPTISLVDLGPPVVGGGTVLAIPIPGVAIEELFSGGGSRLVIHWPIRARLIPDPGSVPAPQAIHGEATASVKADQIVSGAEEVVTIDLGAADVKVNFTPAAGAPLTGAELAVVRQVTAFVVRNAFEPANLVVRLPPAGGDTGVAHWRFKTLPDDTLPALALLLNLQDRRPSDAQRDDFDHIFLRSGDDFALAIGRDYLIPTLRDLIEREARQAIDGTSVTISAVLVSATYNFNVDGAPQVTVGSNGIEVTVSVSAVANNWPDADITVTQLFSLQATPAAVTLKAAGSPDVSINFGGFVGPIANLFSGAIENYLEDQAADAIADIVADAQPLIGDMLSGLQGFLGQLRIPPPQPVYSAAVTSSQGVIVRGNLKMGAWRDVVAAFKVEPAPGQTSHFNALESWVPGGTIERFHWRLVGGTTTLQELTRRHRFTLDSPPDTSMFFARWCLEVRGRRNGQTVSGSTSCGLVVGLYDVVVVGDEGDDESEPGLRLPVAVLDDEGRVRAHLDLSPNHRQPGGRAIRPQSNVLVHFAGDDPGATLGLLRAAESTLQNPERSLLVVSVLQPGALNGTAVSREPNARGASIVWAEDFEDSWARAFGVRDSREAILLNPGRRVAWRSAQRAGAPEVVEALAEYLEPVPQMPPRLIISGALPGARATDFLLDYAGETRIALRTLRGRPVLLTFFTTWSQPSLRALQALHAAHEELLRDGWLLLAINDGEDGEKARELFAEHAFSLRLMADPQRLIAQRYGIRAWPTTITIDRYGDVSSSDIGDLPSIVSGAEPGENGGDDSYEA